MSSIRSRQWFAMTSGRSKFLAIGAVAALVGLAAGYHSLGRHSASLQETELLQASRELLF